MNHLAVLTTGRQDWGILRSTVMRLRQDQEFRLTIIAGGMACDERFGNLAVKLETEALAPLVRVPWEIRLENGANKSREAAAALAEIAEALRQLRPEAFILVGDRSETLAAAMAAVMNAVPVIHLHGGEETEGALDNYYRHAISKLSRVHFVSHSQHRERLLRMGENPNLVFTVGAPGIDNLHRPDLPPADQVLKDLGLSKTENLPLLLVTYHPPTQNGDSKREIDGLLTALGRITAVSILTLPNDDPGNAPVRQAMAKFAAAEPSQRVVVSALGEDRYWALLKRVDAVLGNSSSGLIEAPAIPVPVLNLGRRQQGRHMAPCVVNVPEPEPAAMAAALAKCLDPAFRRGLRVVDAPYGTGHSAERIVQVLKEMDWQHLPPKRFCE